MKEERKMTDEALLEALYAIDWAKIHRTEWVKIGMALKAEGLECDIWDEWSATDPETDSYGNRRYDPKECVRIWKTFSREDGVDGSVIVALAKESGWKPDHPITTGLHKADPLPLSGLRGTKCDFLVRPPVDEYRDLAETMLDAAESTPGWEQLVQYITTIYRPDDIIPVVTQCYPRVPGGKKEPGKARFWRASTLIESLKKTHDIPATIGHVSADGGAWIGQNAFTGDGQKQDDVITYRYTLIESDDGLGKVEQIVQLLKADLPIAALIWSGGHSVHAVVHVDAKTIEQYDKRVRYLHDYLTKIKGLNIDPQPKQCNRTPRLPGVPRGADKQTLIATCIGPKSYAEWIARISGLE